MSKITKEDKERMVELRKQGKTYREIMDKVGVSKWACNKYLSDIEVDQSWIEEEWKKAEDEAENVLSNMGYENILNLNEICPSAYWDYYCTKKEERWLIDVTINQRKNLVDKALRGLEGFEQAVLIKVNDEWEMLILNTEKIKVEEELVEKKNA